MGKVKFTCEFVVRSSPGILYSFLTSSSSLAQWFSDTCDINGKIYTFGWDGAEEEAERLDFIEDQYVKYRWTDSEEDEFFDFEISKSEISNDTILTINDFYVYLILIDRTYEAKELIESAEELELNLSKLYKNNESNFSISLNSSIIENLELSIKAQKESLYSFSYERFYTVSLWEKFIDNTGRNVIFNDFE